jgi:glycine dehydrogenase subunit 2
VRIRAPRWRGDAREVILVPESAHGTNPATAAFAGYRVENIPATEDGRVDVAALTARLGPDVAGVMITNPNTCGLFERDLKTIADAVHAAAAIYCDGANFNAIVGRVRPGDLGVDAMHINLHKTFSPRTAGAGRVPGRSCCRKRSRLMAAAVHRAAGRRFGAAGRGRRRAGIHPEGFGRMCAFHGQMGMFTRAGLYPQPRRGWAAAGFGRCGAQRQLRAAPAGGCARRAVRCVRPVHARGAVQR